MFKTLDRYIIKKFLGTFIYSIIIIILIAIIFDLSEKLERFVEKGATIQQLIFDYYLYFIPYYTNLFAHLFTFIAVTFFTSKLSARFEIVAMLSGGIGFYRILLPYFISATVIAASVFVLGNFIIPPANKTRFSFEEHYYRTEPYRNQDTNIIRQIQPDVVMYVSSYDNYNDVGYDFTLENFQNNRLNSKMWSDSVMWDSTANKWKAINCRIRTIEGMNESVTHYQELDTAINIKPYELGIRKDNFAESLNWWQLNSFITKQKNRGENVKIYEIEKYKRIASPFSVYILMIIGVSLAMHRVRGGVGGHIGIGLLISAIYIIFMQVSHTFAIDGNMSSLLAVWLPNIVFGVGSVFMLFLFARK